MVIPLLIGQVMKIWCCTCACCCAVLFVYEYISQHGLTCCEGERVVYQLFEPRHFMGKCLSTLRFKVCRQPHCLCLHFERRKEDERQSCVSDSSQKQTEAMTIHVSRLIRQQLELITTFQAQVTGSDGSTYRVRTLLDSALGASFITQCLA